MNKTLGIVVFALLAGLPALPAVAQTGARASAPVNPEAARRHSAALAMEHRGDESGAFTAFLAAAEEGYPPAQRRLGEIYDSGNSAVKRNYEESIRWYQKAREGGEDIPSPPSYGGLKPPPVRVGP